MTASLVLCVKCCVRLVIDLLLGRFQIHVLNNKDIHVYSRNQENNTSKYPDVIARMSQVTELLAPRLLEKYIVVVLAFCGTVLSRDVAKHLKLGVSEDFTLPPPPHPPTHTHTHTGSLAVAWKSAFHWLDLTIAFVFRAMALLRSLENPHPIGDDLPRHCEASRTHRHL